MEAVARSLDATARVSLSLPPDHNMLLPSLLAATTLLALPGASLAHSSSSGRKSLSFGTVHPHASFKTHPLPPSAFHKRSAGKIDALQKAKEHLALKGVAGRDYYIRPDVSPPCTAPPLPD